MLIDCADLAELVFDVNLGTGLPPARVQSCARHAGLAITCAFQAQERRGDSIVSVLVEPYLVGHVPAEMEQEEVTV